MHLSVRLRSWPHGARARPHSSSRPTARASCQRTYLGNSLQLRHKRSSQLAHHDLALPRLPHQHNTHAHSHTKPLARGRTWATRCSCGCRQSSCTKIWSCHLPRSRRRTVQRRHTQSQRFVCVFVLSVTCVCAPAVFVCLPRGCRPNSSHVPSPFPASRNRPACLAARLLKSSCGMHHGSQHTPHNTWFTPHTLQHMTHNTQHHPRKHTTHNPAVHAGDILRRHGGDRCTAARRCARREHQLLLCSAGRAG